MDKELLQWLDGSSLAHEAGTAGELEEQAELLGEELLDIEKDFQQKLKDIVLPHERIRETVVGRVNLALEAETRSGWRNRKTATLYAHIRSDDQLYDACVGLVQEALDREGRLKTTHCVEYLARRS